MRATLNANTQKFLSLILIGITGLAMPIHWQTAHAIKHDSEAQQQSGFLADHVDLSHDWDQSSTPDSTPPLSRHSQDRCVLCHVMAGLHHFPATILQCIQLRLLIRLPRASQSLVTALNTSKRSNPRAPPACYTQRVSL